VDYSHLLKKLPLNFDLLIPFLKFNQELEKELLMSGKKIFFQNEKFIICETLSQNPIWAQDWWPGCELIAFEKKSEAIKILKTQKNLGVFYDSNQVSLSHNIRQELRELKLKRIEYRVPSEFDFNFFCWTMLDNAHLVLCKTPTRRYPLGWHEFNEDKNTPPNRAYLKLWEILCLGHIRLKPTEIVIDLGSSPGGWSWALSQLVKKVYSVDKAPLSPSIAKISSISYTDEDAFKLKPSQYNDCDWLFSDIICTPERLLSLVTEWMKESQVKNFVCTIKFKGPCDFEILKQFNNFENSKIIHLYQNKNEVTWIKQGSS
jgi:23S rRNA (cytidine2498-2'-O)-methyltransferase